LQSLLGNVYCYSVTQYLGIHGTKSIQHSNRTVQPSVLFMVRPKLPKVDEYRNHQSPIKNSLSRGLQTQPPNWTTGCLSFTFTYLDYTVVCTEGSFVNWSTGCAFMYEDRFQNTTNTTLIDCIQLNLTPSTRLFCSLATILVMLPPLHLLPDCLADFPRARA
jgi:hypothetical protein